MRIITDTASDIMESEAAQMNIQMVSIDILFDGVIGPGNTPEGFDQFYTMLEQSEQLPSTSQPSPHTFLSLYEEAGDEDIIVITLSSGLSGTYNSAVLAKEMCRNPRVFVIDSKQAIIPERILVERAVLLRDRGCSAEEIVTEIEELRGRIEVCGILNTLTYLKKGGRIPASIATVGNILGIKAVVALLDTVVTSIGKARSLKSGKEMLWNEYDKCVIDPDFPVYFGYTKDRQAVMQFLEESRIQRSLSDTRIYPVGGSIGTHLGPGAVILCFVSKNPIQSSSISSAKPSRP